jgi:hypothetical protein
VIVSEWIRRCCECLIVSEWIRRCCEFLIVSEWIRRYECFIVSEWIRRCECLIVSEWIRRCCECLIVSEWIRRCCECLIVREWIRCCCECLKIPPGIPFEGTAVSSDMGLAKPIQQHRTKVLLQTFGTLLAVEQTFSHKFIDIIFFTQYSISFYSLHYRNILLWCSNF